MKLNLKIAAPLAVAGVLAAAGASFAATSSPAAGVPAVGTTGTVGYSAVENGNQTYFTHAGGQFGLGDPQYSVTNPQLPYSPIVGALLHTLTRGDNEGNGWVHFTNPAGLTVQGARIGLCGGTRTYGAGTGNAGETVQEYIIPNSTTTYDVVAFEGQFTGNGGDICTSDVLPSGFASIVLQSIPDADTIHLDLLYDGAHSHNGTGPGHATYVATDLSSPARGTNQVSTNDRVFSARTGSEFYESEDGLTGVDGDASSSLASTVVPDLKFPNLAVEEAHVLLNGNTIGGNEVHGSLQSGLAWDVVANASVHGATIEGAVSPFTSDHFGSYTAPGVFPVSVG